MVSRTASSLEVKQWLRLNGYGDKLYVVDVHGITGADILQYDITELCEIFTLDEKDTKDLHFKLHTEPRAKELFTKHDPKNNGYITIREMQSLLVEAWGHQAKNAFFETYKRNYPNANTSDKVVSQLFGASANGRIFYDAFTRTILSKSNGTPKIILPDNEPLSRFYTANDDYDTACPPVLLAKIRHIISQWKISKVADLSALTTDEMACRVNRTMLEEVGLDAYDRDELIKKLRLEMRNTVPVGKVLSFLLDTYQEPLHMEREDSGSSLYLDAEDSIDDSGDFSYQAAVLFDKEDVNHTGELDFDGFKNVIESFGLEAKETSVRVLFDHLDENNRGKIAREKYLDFMADGDAETLLWAVGQRTKEGNERLGVTDYLEDLVKRFAPNTPTRGDNPPTREVSLMSVLRNAGIEANARAISSQKKWSMDDDDYEAFAQEISFDQSQDDVMDRMKATVSREGHMNDALREQLRLSEANASSTASELLTEIKDMGNELKDATARETAMKATIANLEKRLIESQIASNAWRDMAVRLKRYAETMERDQEQLFGRISEQRNSF
eukprot:m.336627 g.336627  ORF g.336627 m.336627 type:complete len:557 (+) comp17910_c0_seq1:236-1906(+)